MAGDQRDWYRDWWRRKTGYVERASFRVGEGERKRMQHAQGWRRNWLLVAAVVLMFVLLKVVLTVLR